MSDCPHSASLRPDTCILCLRADNERLRGIIADRDTLSVHSCHDNCTRIECVQRREIERLRETLGRYIKAVGELATLSTAPKAPEGALESHGIAASHTLQSTQDGAGCSVSNADQPSVSRLQNIIGHAIGLLDTGHVQEALDVLRLTDPTDAAP